MFKALRTRRRIILSGTPIQNDLGEFHAMVRVNTLSQSLIVDVWSLSLIFAILVFLVRDIYGFYTGKLIFIKMTIIHSAEYMKFPFLRVEHRIVLRRKPSWGMPALHKRVLPCMSRFPCGLSFHVAASYCKKFCPQKRR